MKRVKRVVLLALPLSFLIGLWWGRLQFENNRNLLHPHYDLRILSQKQSLPITIIEAFERQSGLKIELIEAADLPSLEKLSHNPLLDIVVYKSYNSKELVGNKKIVNLQTEKLAFSENIQVDFWPSEKYDWKKAIPYSWGVNGFLGRKGQDFETHFKESFSTAIDPLKKNQYTFYFSTDFDALYFVLLQNNLDLKSFISKNKVDLLQAELSHLKSKIKFTNELPEVSESSYYHISSGQAAKYIDADGDYEFYIPEHGALFWMNFVSLTSQGNQNVKSYKFIDYLINPQTQKTLVTKSDLASVLPVATQPLLSANYLRQVHLSKLIFFDEMSDPKLTWQSSVKLSFSDWFEKSEKK